MTEDFPSGEVEQVESSRRTATENRASTYTSSLDMCITEDLRDHSIWRKTDEIIAPVTRSAELPRVIEEKRSSAGAKSCHRLACLSLLLRIT